jgi:hypothetical protein
MMVLVGRLLFLIYIYIFNHKFKEKKNRENVADGGDLNSPVSTCCNISLSSTPLSLSLSLSLSEFRRHHLLKRYSLLTWINFTLFILYIPFPFVL